MRTYPRPGPAASRIILRDERDDGGARHLDATVERDGTLRITGHDQGPRVSDFWGEAITSYDWVHVIAADRIPALLTVLGGHDGDDVLALLAAYHQRAGGQFSDLMTHPRRGGRVQQLAQLTRGTGGHAASAARCPISRGRGVASIRRRATSAEIEVRARYGE